MSFDDPERDPRVKQVNQYQYSVVGREDEYAVFPSNEVLGAWLTSPAFGSASIRRADLRSRDDADRWSEENTIRHDSLRAALLYALTRVGLER